MPVTLMIVDDSEVIRRQIERTLSGQRVKVVGTAGNGVDALELFRTHRPALVTIDIVMPEMDGLTCTEEILAVDPDARILVISALNDELTARAALHRGARGFLAKPFSHAELTTAFSRLLED